MGLIDYFRMTDNSNFVLQWKIKNARATLATGKAESTEFDEAGFRWTAAIEKRGVYAEFSLRCDSDHKGHWKCEGEVDVYVYQNGVASSNLLIKKEPMHIDDKNWRWLKKSAMHWSYFNSDAYIRKNKITVKFRIRIISSERGVVNKFAEPSRMSNVILKIGDEKLHLSKEFLAVHSPVFETLFFGDFEEKGKEEVEIKDVVYEEFLDLLNLIYLGTRKITDHTVNHILRLADRFQMEKVLEWSNEHLIRSEGLDVTKKLLLADQYRLDALRDHCLQLFTNSNDIIQKFKASPEYATFGEGMKGAISDRIMELNL